jgi:16S rRNA (cytosine967-C5)-methyltransferase
MPESTGAAARDVAVALLSGVLDDHEPLDSLLESNSESTPFQRLPPRDRALVRAIVGTVLRRHGQITDVLSRLLTRVPPKSGALMRIMEVGAAQLLFMDVPDHAAVSIAVDQTGRDQNARHFKNLANAVLRRIGRERGALIAGQDAPALNTPSWLMARWTDHYGGPAARAIAEAHQTEPALDVTVRRDPEVWAERLGGQVLPNGSVRFVARGAIDALPGFPEGAWWVQDAAASLPARLLGDLRDKEVADLCAAPGGKTMQLAAAGAHVTAVDRSAARMDRLVQNLARIGLSADVVAGDVLELDAARQFDAVLLDAPCSATGTIRRHPDVAWLKTLKDVTALADLQWRLLGQAAALVRAGGTLIYCTCSLEPEEGEQQARRALAELPLAALPIDATEASGLGSLAAEGWLRTIPSDLAAADSRMAGLTGFFIARFRRK